MRHWQYTAITIPSVFAGSLENIVSLTNKYATKRLDFELRAFEARMRVAILDHNENISRSVLPGDNEHKKNLLEGCHLKSDSAKIKSQNNDMNI